MKLNLAQQPFQNRRPRRRLTGILWTLAGLALVWNGFLFVQYWLGSSNGREELRNIREETDSQVAGIETLREELSRADLAAQNEHVRFLNRKIAERTFPWSLLFDDIAEALPRNVRLDGMAPSIPVQKKGKKVVTVATTIEWIHLDLRGTAKSSEDLLDLVDAMFESSSFTGPVLRNERDVEGEVEFDFSVRYRVAKELQPSEALGPAELTAGGGELAKDAGGSRDVREVAQGQDGRSIEHDLSSSGSRLVDSGAAASPTVRAPATGSRIVEAEINSDRSGSTKAAGLRRDEPEDASAAQPAGGLRASGFRPAGKPSSSRSSATQDRTSGNSARAARRPARTTEEIADQRFGTGSPVAPRLANASGGNGGSL